MKKTIIMFLFLICVGCENNISYNKTINVYTRDYQSGARTTFLKHINLDSSKSNDELFLGGYLEVLSNSDMKIKVMNDPNGIGYISYNKDINDVKVLPLNNVFPLKNKELNKDYPLLRNISIIQTSRNISQSKLEIINAYNDFIINSLEASILFNQNNTIKSEEGLSLWKDLKKNHSICSKDLSQETLKIGGSTSYQLLSQKLKESFKSRCGNINISLNHKGSTDGYEKTVGKQKNEKINLDIAFLSRDLTNEEEGSINKNLIKTVAFDVLVVIINVNNSLINDINFLELNKIYRGERSYW